MDDKPNKNQTKKEGKKGDRAKDQDKNRKNDPAEMKADNCPDRK